MNLLNTLNLQPAANIPKRIVFMHVHSLEPCQSGVKHSHDLIPGPSIIQPFKVWV